MSAWAWPVENFKKAGPYYDADTYTEAVKWLRKVVGQAYIPAQMMNSIMYATGRDVMLDPDTALMFVSKAITRTAIRLP